MTKYILVSGGVISGIGKGVIGACTRFPFPSCDKYKSQTPLSIPSCILLRSTEYKTASSTGLLLRTTGLKVTAIKIDPYMNIDAGTMSPTEHGKLSTFLRFNPVRRNSHGF
jgi:CTP synthase